MIDAFTAITSRFRVRPEVVLHHSRENQKLPAGWKYWNQTTRQSALGEELIIHQLEHEATKAKLKIINYELPTRRLELDGNLPRIGYNSQGHVISSATELRHATKQLSALLEQVLLPADSFGVFPGDTEDHFSLVFTSMEIGYQFPIDFVSDLRPLISTCYIPCLHSHPKSSITSWSHNGAEFSAKAYSKRDVMKACRRNVQPGPPVSRVEFKMQGKKLKDDFAKLNVSTTLSLLRFSDLVRVFQYYLRLLTPKPVAVTRSDDGILVRAMALVKAGHLSLEGQDPIEFCVAQMSTRRGKLFRKRVAAVKLTAISLPSLYDFLIPQGHAELAMPPPAHVEEIRD